ncbi:Uncharacterised protein [Moraxella lacunata]|uniref:Uncharacterized protein n=1 Tax=Moraxella lacunata TaxID=477 RepID=A0A378TU89_MORLA|nr:hypothetical protein [Moraxella lacunata]STZ63263.1 Uncharacterised protein [Moraxella lacunata]
MKKDEYNIEIFKSIREEINSRIGVHYNLILSKLALSGGLFSFLYGKDILISPFFIASIFSLIFDIIIIENLGWIRGAGNYIKNYIENSNLNIVRWETNFAQSSNQWVCFTPIGYILGIWLFSIFWFIGGIIYWTTNGLNILSLLAIFSLIIYTLFLVHRHLYLKINNNTNDDNLSPISECE